MNFLDLTDDSIEARMVATVPSFLIACTMALVVSVASLFQSEQMAYVTAIFVPLYRSWFYNMNTAFLALV